MAKDEINPYQSPETLSRPDAGSQEPAPDTPHPLDEVSGGEIVAIASFLYVSEAALAQSLLESEGIKSQLADEGVVGAYALWSNAVGGVKVVVHGRDAERATRFLTERRQALQANRSREDIEFECEECGAQLKFPGARRGCVETCPKCREWIDVPD